MSDHAHSWWPSQSGTLVCDCGKQKYKVKTSFVDGWLMISVIGVPGMTQARSRDQVALMAREFIAVSLNLRLDDVMVEVC